MKIRVYMANEHNWQETHIEINCEGQPNPGDYFILPREIEKQLLCNALDDYGTAKYFGQWVYHYDDEPPYMSFEDAALVYAVSWRYDNKEDAMMCYVALDADKKGETRCNSERLDYEIPTYDEYLTIKMNTEEIFGL